MIISADARVCFLSLFKKIKNNYSFLSKTKAFNIYMKRGISGPQNFLSDLLINIEKNKLAKTTFNILSSDIHLLNSGFYSMIWKYYSPKSQKKVMLRLDGIGIDSVNDPNKKKLESNIINLVNKSSLLIYQSTFCRNCFKNIYESLPKGKVIINGSDYQVNISEFSKDLQKKVNLKFKKYFVVAGRYIDRKRIQEVINEFNSFEIGNLVVLSNVPENLKYQNERLLYMGMINPDSARYIISNSIGLIHFDRYDWCPNIVVSSLFDGVPIICSNYGGTPEIAGSNSYVIDEFPKDLPHNLEGINFTKNANFPSNDFKENIIEVWKKDFVKKPNKSYDIKYTSQKYINSAKSLLK